MKVRGERARVDPATWGWLGGAAYGAVEVGHIAFASGLDVGPGSLVVLLVVGAGMVGLPGAVLAGALGLVPRLRAVGRTWAFLAGLACAASMSFAVTWFTDPPPFQDPFPLQGHPLAFLGLGIVAPAAAVALLAAAVRRWRWAGVVVYGVLLAVAAFGVTGGQLPVGEPVAPSGRPNVLLVTLDTTRADRFGSDRVATPGFDRLAAEGVRFDQAWAPIPVTGPSHATLLSGQPPWRTGMLLNGSPVPPEATMLAERLRESGYDTGAFVSAYVLQGNLGFDRGFSVYDDDFAWIDGLQHTLPGRLVEMFRRRDPAHIAERRGEWTVTDALSWLDGRESAWFAWVHLFDPHGPYEPPPPWDSRYYQGRDPRDPANDSMDQVDDVPVYLQPAIEGITDVSWIIAQYDGEIAYADAQLQRLLEWLDDSDQAKDTLVIVVADHGEGLGEHGQWFTHGTTLYPHDLHVPLAMRLPRSIPAGTVVDDPVELGDLAPTVLSYLDLLPDPTHEGVSLRSTIDGGPAPRAVARSMAFDVEANRASRVEEPDFPPTWVQLAVHDGTSRYLLRQAPGWEDEARGADLSRQAQALLAEWRDSGRSPEIPELSDSDRALLEALGYVDAPEASCVPPRPVARECPLVEAAGPATAFVRGVGGCVDLGPIEVEGGEARAWLGDEADGTARVLVQRVPAQEWVVSPAPEWVGSAESWAVRCDGQRRVLQGPEPSSSWVGEVDGESVAWVLGS